MNVSLFVGAANDDNFIKLITFPFQWIIYHLVFEDISSCTALAAEYLPSEISVMVKYSGLYNMFMSSTWPSQHKGRETLIARFIWPQWVPSGAQRTQVGPMLAHEPCYLGSIESNPGAEKVRFPWDCIKADVPRLFSASWTSVTTEIKVVIMTTTVFQCGRMFRYRIPGEVNTVPISPMTRITYIHFIVVHIFFTRNQKTDSSPQSGMKWYAYI